MPVQCVVSPCPTGDCWKDELQRQNCHGNLIVLKLPSTEWIMRNNFIRTGGQPSTDQAASVIVSRLSRLAPASYIGMRVLDTHDLSDLNRSVASGLSITLIT